MFESAGRVMFTALHAAATERLGEAHPCTEALSHAAASAGPDAVRAAELALKALAEPDRLALLERAHRALRADPGAWLALWPGGARRPH